jgi:hypothetical protein
LRHALELPGEPVEAIVDRGEVVFVDVFVISFTI